MAINLGNVNFGVGADTAGMQRALRALERFSRVVDQTARSQAQGAAAATAAYIRQEHAIQRAIQQTLNLNAAIRRAGADVTLIGQNTRSLNILIDQFTRGRVSAVEFNRQLDLFNVRLNRNSRALKDFVTSQRAGSAASSRFAQVIRDLESASVLAVGPLSGIGARIRALSSITTRSTLAIAGFIAGVTGASVGIYKLATGAVTTQRSFQQIEATLRAVTGSTTLAGNEFRFVLENARRLGLELETTAQQYAQLTATTRGTNLQGEGTRDIFLGIAEAAAALNLPIERTQRAFNAVSQIVSKNVVQQEELRGQLAEAIPGAVQLAARALEVNTEQLNDMIKSGDVLASDLLPKLASLLRSTFGTEAARNSERLNGTINNLSTSMYQFNLALDNAVGFSTAWRNSLAALTSALDFLTHNMDNLIGVVGAFVGIATVAFGPTVIRGVALLASWIARLTAAVWGLNTAFAATGIAGIVGSLARLAVVVGAAVAGFVLFKNAAQDSSDATALLIDDVDNFIRVSEEMGGAMKATTDQYIGEIQKRIQAQQVLVDQAQQAYREEKAALVPLNALWAQFLQGWGIDAEDPAQALDRVSEELLQLQLRLESLHNIPAISPFGGDSGEASDEFDAAKDKIADLIAELEMYGNALQAIPNAEAVQSALDLGEALDLIKDVPTAELSGLDSMLAAIGFSTGTTAERLAMLISALDRAEEAVDDFQQRIEDTPEVLADFNEEMHQLQMAIDAMANGPKAFEQFEDSQKVLDKVAAMREELVKTSLTQEEINRLLAEYQDRLNVYDMAAEKLEDLEGIQKKVTQSIDRAFDRIGETITEAFVKGEDAAISFQNVVEGVLSEIIQMILDIALLDPLKDFLGSVLSGVFSAGSIGGTSGGHPVMGAQGRVISGGKITRAAQGAILTKRTMIRAANGSVLAREAGRDEAIMPLVRTSNNDLGVRAVGGGGSPNITINIIDNAGNDITSEQRSDGRGNIEIDVMIDRAVAAKIRSPDSYTAKAMRDTFGVRQIGAHR
jgi:tape measure domain-containing protein